MYISGRFSVASLMRLVLAYSIYKGGKLLNINKKRKIKNVR